MLVNIELVSKYVKLEILTSKMNNNSSRPGSTAVCQIGKYRGHRIAVSQDHRI